MLRVNLASFTLLAMFFGYCNLSYAGKIREPDPALNSNPPLQEQFQVKATIQHGCEFGQASYNLPLTVKDSTLASSDSVAVTVLCTLDSNVTISTDFGKNNDNNQRRLVNEKGQFINYTLSMSEQTTGAGAETVSHTFSSLSRPYEFYIKATADITNAKAGNYTDTVTFITTF